MTDLDRQLAEAIKTIRKAQGWRVCPVRYGYWHGPGVACDEAPDPGGVATCWAPFFLRPDPLADTPEGDHAFMEIARWAEKWVDGLEGRFTTERTWSYRHNTNQRLYDVVFTRGRELLGRGLHPSFKAAFLLALAAALEEQG